MSLRFGIFLQLAVRNRSEQRNPVCSVVESCPSGDDGVSGGNDEYNRPDFFEAAPFFGVIGALLVAPKESRGARPCIGLLMGRTS